MDTFQNQQLTKQERRALRRQEQMTEQQRRARKRFMKRVFLWSAATLIIGVGVFGMTKLASRPPQDAGPTTIVDAISAEDWVRGSPNARVVLIEYSDFQCPACAFYYPILKKISEDFGDTIVIAYRHFPLPQHRNAKPAAYAAEAAGKQGKFWEMHNIIFDNQNEWSEKRNADEIFTDYAKTLNLDLEQFKNDFVSTDIKKKIDSAYQASARLGLNSTPTFFLNGKKITNPRNYEDFRAIIIQTINENP